MHSKCLQSNHAVCEVDYYKEIVVLLQKCNNKETF